jgi:hypothetical protein
MNEQLRESVVFVSIERECVALEDQSAQGELNEDTLKEAQNSTVGQRKSKLAEPIEGDSKVYFQRFHDSIVELARKVRESIFLKYPSVKILEFRTSVISLSDGLNLLVVLDAVDIDTELQIGITLSDIEKDFFNERKISCGIRSIKKNKYVDGTKVTEQFPFLVRV